jgi:hypothetical protein
MGEKTRRTACRNRTVARTIPLFTAEGLERRVLLSSAITAFGARQTYAVGQFPDSVAVSDFNADGIPDLAVANQTGSVSVLLGNGNGTFRAQQTFAVGQVATSVAVSDVNHDSKPDLVVASVSYVSVLLGNGNGTFQAQQTLATEPNPRAVAIADVNGDGNPDLVVTNFNEGSTRAYPGSVSVLLGNGDGTFRAQQSFAIGADSWSVAVSDLNLDGKPDIVLANRADDTLGLLVGNGNGTFQPQTTIATGSLPGSVTASDVNGDGKPDLVVANYASNDVEVMLGNGNGTFQSPQTLATAKHPYSVLASDVNGDGKPDLIVTSFYTSTADVLLGNGDGTFRTMKTFAAGSESIAVADLNSDGRPDLVSANIFSSSISVLLGDVPPVVTSINRASPLSTQTSPTGVSFTVTFNEPVSGVDPGDFPLALSGVTANPSVQLAGSGSVYTVTVSGVSGVGTVGLNLVDDGNIQDAAGNPLQPGGTAAFQAPQTFATRGGSRAVAAADLNGDGKADLVLVGGTAPVSVLLGNGNGTFQPQITFPGTPGFGIDSVAVADLNGDGKPDIVVTMVAGDTAYGRLGVLLGNGDGTFQAIRTIVIGVYPQALAITDLNGDGKLDVVVANDGNSNFASVGVLLGNGNGTFQSQRTYPAGLFPLSVAVSDVNRDGSPDLVVADGSFNSTGHGTVNVLLNNGDGTFGSPRTVAVPGSPYFVAAADVNGDGNSDLLVAARGLTGTVSVLLGNGNGTFQSAQNFPGPVYPGSIAVTDLNGDGKPDLILSDHYIPAVETLLGNGNGTFQPLQSFSAGKYLASAAIADVNGDGRPDIVGVSGGYAATVLLANTDGSFTGQLYTIIEPPIAAFGPQQLLPAGSQPRFVTTADVNGDGKTDLIVANASGNTVGVMLGNGNSTFQSQQTFASGANPFAVVVGDVNGDGRPDLVVADNAINAVSVLLGNGNGTFQPQQTFATGPGPRSVQLADINGDGNPDVVVANYSSNSISILFGNGDGTFQAQQTFATGSQPRSLAIADVNRDGKPDVIVANHGSNSVSVLLGNGNGSLRAQQTFATGASPFSVAASDVNLDGAQDILVSNTVGNSVGVLLGNGNGTFQSQQTFATGAGPIAIAAMDVNSDGKPDLVVADYNDSTAGVLLGNGDGTFAPQKTFSVGAGPRAVAVADVNGDGRQDLIAADASANSLSVLIADVPPVVRSINRTNPAGPSTSSSSLSFTVTFNEPVTGVNPGDFALALSGVAASTPVLVSGTGAVYTVTVTGVFGSGTLGLNLVDNGSIKDAAGNPLQPGGTAAFQLPETFATGPKPTSIAVSDINGDGRPDFVFANVNGPPGVSILLGGLNGSLQPYQSMATGVNSQFVALGDLNGDGKPDLVVGEGYAIGVLLGNGNGTFQPQTTIAIPNPVTSVLIADVNGDGRPDVLFTERQFVGVLLGNGNGTFRVQQSFYSGYRSSLQSIAVGDLNGDGKPDLVVADSGNDQATVLLGNGNGTFQPRRAFAAGYGPSSVVIADVNQDGRPDLVLANAGSNSVSVLLGNGNGTFQPQRTFSTGAGSTPRSVAVADLNGDGLLDIVTANVGNFLGRSVAVMLGNGDGTFLPTQTFATGKAPETVIVADVNGDGRLDLITSNYDSNNATVLLGAVTGSFIGQTYTIVPFPDTINGTAGNDSITLGKNTDGTDINWMLGASSGQLPINDPNGLTINGNGGNDVITLDYTNGNPLPNTLHLNGTFTINNLQGTNPFAGTTLDVGRSTVFVSYSSADPIAAIQSYLKNGYNSGAWNGAPTASTGVITSLAASANPNHTTAIGYADFADGQGINTVSNTIELKYTLYGDANLDGQVNSTDLQILLFSLNRAGAWDQGDFNYDAQVNSADLQALLFTLNTNLGSQATPMAIAATPAATTAASLRRRGGDPSSPAVPAIHPIAPPGPVMRHAHPAKASSRKRR